MRLLPREFPKAAQLPADTNFPSVTDSSFARNFPLVTRSLTAAHHRVLIINDVEGDQRKCIFDTRDHIQAEIQHPNVPLASKIHKRTQLEIETTIFDSSVMEEEFYIRPEVLLRLGGNIMRR